MPEFLSEETEIFLLQKQKLSELREDLSASVLYRLKQFDFPPFRHLFFMVQLDPGWVPSFCYVILRRFFKS